MIRYKGKVNLIGKFIVSLIGAWLSIVMINWILNSLNVVNPNETNEERIRTFENQCNRIKDTIINSTDEEVLDIINSKNAIADIYILDKEGKVLLKSDNSLETTFSIEKMKDEQIVDSEDYSKKYNLIYNNPVNNTLILFEGNLRSSSAKSDLPYVIVFVISFLGIFCLLNLKREKYIKLICDGLKEIATGDFDYVIKVKGKGELSEISKNINEMNKQLKHTREQEKIIESEKDKFIMNISHDLRTPLTSIIGYVNLIKDTDYNEESIKKYIEIIDFKSESLNKMINDFFEYNKLNLSEVTLSKSKICINEFLRQVVASMMVIADKENKIIELKIKAEDIYLNFDGEKMFRVMENLLTNALKYSSDNSKIYVTCNEEIDKVCIKVKNRVDHQEQINIDKIFQRMYRGDKARRTNKGGAGLGLAIAEKIIQLHGGAINAKFEGETIVFSITLMKNLEYCRNSQRKNISKDGI